MTFDPDRIFDSALSETIRLHQAVMGVGREPVVRVATAMAAAIARDGKVLAFGNGGSASDAQHFAAELVGRFLQERRALPAIALTTDSSIVTAVANDYGYDRVFARQVEALGRPGDVAIGITTSGRSANVIAAFEAAKSRGVTTVALTGGDGGPAGAMADMHVNVPDPATPRVQEVHRTLLHVICEILELQLAGAGPGPAEATV
jgi:D-sedoheptulose 7-phosphate isomerase